MNQCRAVCLTVLTGIVALFSLVGCSAGGERLTQSTTPAEVDCEYIRASYFPALLNTLHPENATTWITEQFLIDATEIKHTRAEDGSVEALGWTQEGRRSSLWFRDGQLFQLMVLWRVPGPTGSKVVECFGPPSFYSASQALGLHGEVSTTLSIYYPDRGLTIAAWPRDEASINPDLHFNSFFYTHAGSIEDLIEMGSKTGLTEAQIQASINHIRSWPGSWENIVVEPIPSR